MSSPKNTNQPTDAERLERARWRSRRGLLELELLLKPFVEGALQRFQSH